MSDQSQGPGWWLASDGKWYPPTPGEPSEPASGGTSTLAWWRTAVPLWTLIIVGVAGMALGAILSSFASGDGTTQVASVDADGGPTTTAKGAASPRPTTTTTRPTTTTAPAYVPVPEDFKIDLITTEKECFGSAGCLIEYTVDVTYVGATLPDPSTTFTVIYEVQGGDDPKTASFEVTGDTIRYTKSDRSGTPSADSVLTAVPTSVIE